MGTISEASADAIAGALSQVSAASVPGAIGEVSADVVPGTMNDVPAGGSIPAHVTVLIARIARSVRQRFEQVLTPLGLRQRHLVALSYLRGHGPTAQQNLADRLRMDASSMVCLLNDLEENHLVVRHRDRSDRRRGLVELSERGEQALSKVDAAVQVVEDEILGGLEPSERQLLRDLLARLDVGEPDWGLIVNEG